MKIDLRIENIGNRRICIGGVGVLFYQEGFPIGMSAKELGKLGIELSWLHVAKELMYQYNSNERLFAKLKEEAEDAKIDGLIVDLDILRDFVYGSFEDRQKYIFAYLFGDMPANDNENAKDFFLTNFNRSL